MYPDQKGGLWRADQVGAPPPKASSIDIGHTMGPRRQDEFWLWFTDPCTGDLRQPSPPSGLVTSVQDCLPLSSLSRPPKLAPAEIFVPCIIRATGGSSFVPGANNLPIYYLNESQRPWCQRCISGFCVCYRSGVRIFLTEGWGPLAHIFHLVLGFLVPEGGPKRASWWAMRGRYGWT